MNGDTLSQVLSGQGLLNSSMLVEWKAGDESWSEVTRLLDVDPRGATFSLSRCPELGQLLRLKPQGRQTHGQAEGDDDAIWALVWALTQTGGEAARGRRRDPARHVASVIFFGNDVPRSFADSSRESFGYVAEEEGIFRLRRESVADQDDGASVNRRRESRIHLPVEVTAEALDDEGQVVSREVAVTENISRHGAALRTTLQLPLSSRVRLTCEQYDLAVHTIVRACHTGPDHIGRLHLEFLDGSWPID